jgi:putative IMPACT (imprinted ancient) family translation regulator
MRVSGEIEFKHVVERSRFFATLFGAAGEADVEAMLRVKRGEHRKANHHCWALRCRGEGGTIVERSKDDGEVGHPGRVLLDLLKHHDLEGALLVSRVFGGVKLGVGGVSRAFREAGASAIAAFLASTRGGSPRTPEPGPRTPR